MKLFLGNDCFEEWSNGVNEYRPMSWFSDSDPPDEPGVYYVDSSGRHNRLYLSSFAQWCGEEVK